MDFDDIVKIVDQVKVLEARLAVAEAEREKYQGLADNRLNCMALYRDLTGKHEARIGVLADKLNLAEAERDAAQAGEARAVEALKAVIAGAYPHEEEIWTMEGVVLRHVHRVLDQYEPTLDNQPPALAWLAQQRREAAAEWIEKEATENRQRMGEYYERSVEGMLKEAAALRAGEVPNE